MTLFRSLFRVKPQPSHNIEILNVEDFKTHISNKQVQLIDVRTPREHNAGHIKGSLNIDYFRQNTFKSAIKTLDKSKPVYLYCRSGSRSQKVARKLAGMGFETIYDLKGGYMSWY